MATYTRVYIDRIIKWMSENRIVGIPLLFLFAWLAFRGDITIKAYSGDMICAGDETDPCYAHINFTMNKDYIYIYPNEQWKLYTDTPLENLEMETRDRRTTSGWRKVDITRACSWLNPGTPCRLKYAYRFYKSKGLWEIRFVAYKSDPTADIKWGFGPIDPTWFGINGTSGDVYVEHGYGTNFTCTPGCNFTTNNSVLGRFVRSQGPLNMSFIWNFSMNGLMQFNDTNFTQNHTFPDGGSSKLSFFPMNGSDKIDNALMDITGGKNDSVYPHNVTIDIGNDGTNDIYLIGNLTEKNLTAYQFDNGNATQNFSLTGIDTKTDQIRVTTNLTVLEAKLNVTGYGSVSRLSISGTPEMCGNYFGYDFITIESGAEPTVCTYNGTAGTGYVNLRATTNITILGEIDARHDGYRGGDPDDGDGESFDGKPGTGGGIYSCGFCGGSGGGYGGYGGKSLDEGGSQNINGSVYGTSNKLQDMYMGSGGCMGAGDENGGNGGGAIILNATNVVISGKLDATGDRSPGTGERGGGGSGGLIMIISKNLYLSGATLDVEGGTGAGNAGAGGGGRIKLFYEVTKELDNVNWTYTGGPTKGNGEAGGVGTNATTQITYNTTSTQFAINPSIAIGSTVIWSQSGTFTTENTTGDFSGVLNAEIADRCSGGYCDIPLYVSSENSAIIGISVIRINSTAGYNMSLNKTAMENTLPVIPINITTYGKGKVHLDNVNISYFGNGVYNITAWNGTHGTQLEHNLYIRYSNFSKGLPYTWTPYILWIQGLTSNSSANVTPWGQTDTTPIFNVTWTNVAENASLAIRINDTGGNASCLNYTVANNSLFQNSFNLTTNFTRIYHNRLFNSTNTTHIWASVSMYNCNGTAIAAIARDLELKACCISCSCGFENPP